MSHKVIDTKRAKRERAIREAITLTTGEPAQDEQHITPSSAGQIVQAIKEGRWTSTQVVIAFIKSAIRAQDETNCITEVMFSDALVAAKELDAHFAATNEIKGPLHGVPISFKDLIDVKGYDSSMGFSTWANKPATVDADIVHQVRKAGGIPLVKTNVPQNLANYECSNPLWGVTKNPYNAKYIPGGSTGGEGSLLAMNGSAIGWGSDIGGSIRIPSHFCGLYGLKPGSGRISLSGTVDPRPGFKSIPTVLGPMARTVEDIEIASRVVFGKWANDSAAPVPYREVQLETNLKFGYYFSDGMAQTTPACSRAISETVEALRNQGHECVEFELPSPGKATEVFMALFTASGNQHFFDNKGPDPTEPNLKRAYGYIPGFLRALIGWYFKRVDPVVARVWMVLREKSTREFISWEVKKSVWIREFHEKVWDAHGFDAIIGPGLASPALIHDATQYLLALCAGTLVYNLLDCPVGSIPVTRVDPKLDALPKDGPTTNTDNTTSKLINQVLYGKKWGYDASAMEGLPVGIQLVGRRWEDEKVVEIMKVVDAALGERGFGADGWEKWKDARSN